MRTGEMLAQTLRQRQVQADIARKQRQRPTSQGSPSGGASAGSQLSQSKAAMQLQQQRAKMHGPRGLPKVPRVSGVQAGVAQGEMRVELARKRRMIGDGY